MNAKENKALALAAIAVIMLGQPALARGGGFGSGFGGGFSGGMHGFGGMGVHGFSSDFSSSMHEGGGSSRQGAGNRSMSGQHKQGNDRASTNQTAEDGNGNHDGNNFDNSHDNDNSVTNNFNGNQSWAQNHPYEAAGAADYAWNHGAGNYAAYGYGAPYGYCGGVGIFPDFPMIIDNQTSQQPAAVVQQNNPPAQPAHPYDYGTYNSFNPEQQEMMRQRARVFAQELVTAIGQHHELAPQAVNNSMTGNGNLRQ